jgi:hypothetical protein
MRMLNRKDFPEKGERLIPQDLGGKDYGVGTIDAVEDKEVRGIGKSKYLTFEQFGEKQLFLNATMIDTLSGQLGEDLDEWIGVTVPLEVRTVTNISNGKDTRRVYICDAELWPKILKAAGAKAIEPKGGRKARK